MALQGCHGLTSVPLHRTGVALSMQRTGGREYPGQTCFLRNKLTQRNQVSYSMSHSKKKEDKNLGQDSFFAALAMRSKLAEAPDRQCLQIRWVTLKPWCGATKKQDQKLCEVCFTVCFTRRPRPVLPAPRKQGSVFNV